MWIWALLVALHPALHAAASLSVAPSHTAGAQCSVALASPVDHCPLCTLARTPGLEAAPTVVAPAQPARPLPPLVLQPAGLTLPACPPARAPPTSPAC